MLAERQGRISEKCGIEDICPGGMGVPPVWALVFDARPSLQTGETPVPPVFAFSAFSAVNSLYSILRTPQYPGFRSPGGRVTQPGITIFLFLCIFVPFCGRLNHFFESRCCRAGFLRFPLRSLRLINLSRPRKSRLAPQEPDGFVSGASGNPTETRAPTQPGQKWVKNLRPAAGAAPSPSSG